MYLDLLALLQTHEDCRFFSLMKAVSLRREWDSGALSKTLTELRKKGFVSLIGSDTMKTATELRLNTFGELPR